MCIQITRLNLYMYLKIYTLINTQTQTHIFHYIPTFLDLVEVQKVPSIRCEFPQDAERVSSWPMSRLSK